MLGFNGIFSGIVFSNRPKIKVLSFAEQSAVCRAAAKIYLVLLHADLFESFEKFKKIVFSSKAVSQKEIKFQKIYSELLKITNSVPNKKCIAVSGSKKEDGKVCKIAIDFF